MFVNVVRGAVLVRFGIVVAALILKEKFLKIFIN